MMMMLRDKLVQSRSFNFAVKGSFNQSHQTFFPLALLFYNIILFQKYKIQ